MYNDQNFYDREAICLSVESNIDERPVYSREMPVSRNSLYQRGEARFETDCSLERRIKIRERLAELGQFYNEILPADVEEPTQQQSDKNRRQITPNVCPIQSDVLEQKQRSHPGYSGPTFQQLPDVVERTMQCRCQYRSNWIKVAQKNKNGWTWQIKQNALEMQNQRQWQEEQEMEQERQEPETPQPQQQQQQQQRRQSKKQDRVKQEQDHQRQQQQEQSLHAQFQENRLPQELLQQEQLQRKELLQREQLQRDEQLQMELKLQEWQTYNRNVRVMENFNPDDDVCRQHMEPVLLVDGPRRNNNFTACASPQTTTARGGTSKSSVTFVNRRISPELQKLIIKGKWQ